LPKHLYIKNKLVCLNYFRASRDILYARQAPSDEKKYINKIIIFQKNKAENIKLI